MKSYFRFLLLISLFIIAGSPTFASGDAKVQTNNNQTSALISPKREFRGAWIQCVNGQFLGMGTQVMQDDLTRQLDILQSD